jgi:nicotinate-nucleotide adenylyltransferase
MRIGICGGTFDPFHRGHLDPILAARGTMQWDRVVYVPAHKQPFKTGRESASGHHRFAMAALATLDHDALLVSDVELERGAISYSVDTLEQLREQHHDDTLDWVIGDDNLAQLLEWKSIGRIFELANFAVLTRSGAKAPPPELAPRVAEPAERSTRGAIVFAENATVPVSSTEIRRRVGAGEPIDELVDPRVSRYIHHYGLYRKDTRERFD